MTAVEFLQEKIKIYLPSIHQKGLEDAFKQANKMFEQHIIDAYEQGSDDEIVAYDGTRKYKHGLEYYTSTYGSKGSDDAEPKNYYYGTDEFGTYGKIYCKDKEQILYTEEQVLEIIKMSRQTKEVEGIKFPIPKYTEQEIIDTINS